VAFDFYLYVFDAIAMVEAISINDGLPRRNYY